MKNLTKKMITFLTLLFIFTPLIIAPIILKGVNGTEDRGIEDSDAMNRRANLRHSLINGYDLYSEQIQFFLAGQHVMIRQSAITDDKYIVDQVPLEDEAFINASIIIYSSNGIYPPTYTDAYVPFNELVSLQTPINGIVVYILYGNDSQNAIQRREKRAYQILQDAFQVELFPLETDRNDFFAYYGVQPSMDLVLESITSQLPTDGYFSYLDKERILNQQYLQSHHLSGGLISIDPNSGNLDELNIISGLDSIFEQFNINTSEFEDLLGLNFTSNNDTSTNLIDDKLSLIFVQYEGNQNGVTYSQDKGTFNFDAKATLGGENVGLGDEDVIKPSLKVWNSLLNGDPTGIMTTLIDVNVIGGDVKDWTFNTNNLTIDDYMLDTLYLASSFFTSEDFNIIEMIDMMEFIIDNVFFITHWEKTGVNTKLFMNVNMTRDGYQEILNNMGYSSSLITYILDEITLDDSPLSLIGFTGLPFLITGFLEPIPNIQVEYFATPNLDKPDLIMTHVVDNPVKPINQQINCMLNVTNVGTETAWGVKIGHGRANTSELTNGFINLGSIDYEIRGFYVPSLLTANMFNIYYGSENLLLNVSTYQGPLSMQSIQLLDLNGDGYIDLHEAQVLTSTDPYNYIEPGKSILIDLSSQASVGVFTTFENESANFTSVDLSLGEETENVTTNNFTNAWLLDGATWNVTTVNVNATQKLLLNFTFTNETTNLNESEIDALGFTYFGFNNASINGSGNISLSIYNYNKSMWIPINNLTRTNIDLNQTSFFTGFDYFRIYEGDNDSAGNPIKLSDYMDGPNNTVLVSLTIDNDQPIMLALDYFGMDYLTLNQTFQFMPSRTLTYTDQDGFIRQTTASDSLYLSTENTSVLLLQQSLDDQSSNYLMAPGDVASIKLNVTNAGSCNATDVNVSVYIPGIIIDKGDFDLDGNFLVYSTECIPNATTLNLAFKFKIPNSLKLPGARVEYNNETLIRENDSDYIIRSNDLYLDAPVSFTNESTMPFLMFLSPTATFDENDGIPDANDPFTIQVASTMRNNAANLQLINFSIPKSLYFSNTTIWHVSTKVDGSKSNFTLQKTSYKGYLLPSLELTTDNNNMSALMRYNVPEPVQVGVLSLTLKKNVYKNGIKMDSQFNMIRGQQVEIEIIIINSGNLPIGYYELESGDYFQGFQILDNSGFNQSGFDIVSGTVSFSNLTLDPGENKSITYTIEAVATGTFQIGSVMKTYYFITSRQAKSESYTVLINEKIELIVLYLGISSGGIAIIAGLTVRVKKKQKRAYLKFIEEDKILYSGIKKDERDYAEFLDEDYR
ncbi:MAG: hypothetical protein ACTSXP_00685 [Promethearchaeota archaeon]